MDAGFNYLQLLDALIRSENARSFRRQTQIACGSDSTKVLFGRLRAEELSCRKKQDRTEKRNQNPSCVCLGNNRNLLISLTYHCHLSHDAGRFRPSNRCPYRYRGRHMPARAGSRRRLLKRIPCGRGCVTGGIS